MKTGRAIVILATLILATGVLNFWYTVKSVGDSNHDWCDIIHASVPAIPPSKPLVPGVNPKADKAYSSYQLVIKLGHRKGCL